MKTEKQGVLPPLGQYTEIPIIQKFPFHYASAPRNGAPHYHILVGKVENQPVLFVEGLSIADSLSLIELPQEQSALPYAIRKQVHGWYKAEKSDATKMTAIYLKPEDISAAAHNGKLEDLLKNPNVLRE